jgi:hypothetical protein
LQLGRQVEREERLDDAVRFAVVAQRVEYGALDELCDLLGPESGSIEVRIHQRYELVDASVGCDVLGPGHADVRSLECDQGEDVPTGARLPIAHELFRRRRLLDCLACERGLGEGAGLRSDVAAAKEEEPGRSPELRHVASAGPSPAWRHGTQDVRKVLLQCPAVVASTHECGFGEDVQSSEQRLLGS